MSALNINSLAKFAADLRRLPRVVAQRVCEEAAPKITALGRETFGASEDAYGAAWKLGAEGQTVTLRKSGALARALYYVAIGTKLRVALGVPYAKFQIGRRPVFPTQGNVLPEAYQSTLSRTAVEVVRQELGR